MTHHDEDQFEIFSVAASYISSTVTRTVIIVNMYS